MNPRHNELLASLPSEEFALFFPRLELASLRRGQVLFEQGEVPRHVYFPIGTLISVICTLDDGASMESIMISKSSLVGSTNHGVPSFYKAQVRKAGFAYRLDLGYYRHIINRCPAYNQALNRAHLAAFRHISITGVCGRNHRVEQQLARWMLLHLDLTAEMAMQVTHAELARLLGFRREVITTVLGRMVEAGAITTARGSVEIKQREVLERLACHCYWQLNGQARPVFTSLL